MFVLLRLEPPNPPLLTDDEIKNISEINSYLQTLVGYLYNCNAFLIESNNAMSLTSSGTGTAEWIDGVLTNISGVVTVSPNYTGGSVVFKVSRRSTTGTNTAIMLYTVTRIRDNAATLSLVAGVGINFTPGDTNTHTTTITLTAPSIQPGDILRIDIARVGSDGGDTMTGGVQNDGITVSFV